MYTRTYKERNAPAFDFAEVERHEPVGESLLVQIPRVPAHELGHLVAQRRRAIGKLWQVQRAVVRREVLEEALCS